MYNLINIIHLRYTESEKFPQDSNDGIPLQAWEPSFPFDS